MNRFAVFALLLAWSWLTMTLLHELGHIVVGCGSGAKLTSVEIRPWCLPYSFFATNSRPLMTLWGGPIIGCAIPLLFAWLIKKPSAWFVAWFCIVANGVYLLVGCYSGDAELDSVKMIKSGMPTSLLAIVAGGMTVVGYVGFRNECQRVLRPVQDNQEFVAMSQRSFLASCSVLMVVVLIQTAAGTALR